MQVLFQQFTAVPTSTTEMSLTKHVYCSHETHDKLHHCSTWCLCVRTQASRLIGHRSSASFIALCWKPAHVLINRCHCSATSCIGVLPRDAMRKRGLCCRMCPFVRLSRWWIVPTRLKISSNFFLSLVALPF